MQLLVSAGLLLPVLVIAGLAVLRSYLVYDRHRHRQAILQQAQVPNDNTPFIVGFFHPYW